MFVQKVGNIYVYRIVLLNEIIVMAKSFSSSKHILRRLIIIRVSHSLIIHILRRLMIIQVSHSLIICCVGLKFDGRW